MAGEVERDAIGVWRGVVCCTVGSAVLVCGRAGVCFFCRKYFSVYFCVVNN